MDIGFIVIVVAFIIYYLTILIKERKIIQDPKEILEKFLSILLLYAGISIIYFALTGNPFLNESEDSYRIYLFIIGFIATLWTIPNLLEEFTFFRKFQKKGKRKK